MDANIYDEMKDIPKKEVLKPKGMISSRKALKTG